MVLILKIVGEVAPQVVAVFLRAPTLTSSFCCFSLSKGTLRPPLSLFFAWVWDPWQSPFLRLQPQCGPFLRGGLMLDTEWYAYIAYCIARLATSLSERKPKRSAAVAIYVKVHRSSFTTSLFVIVTWPGGLYLRSSPRWSSASASLFPLFAFFSNPMTFTSFSSILIWD